MKHSFEKFCKDYKNIENYDKAAADNFKGWCCHHRLQTWTSDGERRQVDISMEELKALGMYYNRPASELIFLKRSGHQSLHQKGKKRSTETRKKMSEAKKGEKNNFYGKKHTEETRMKMSAARKGKPKTEETRKKMGASKKGTRWFNNGKINIRANECPDGFVTGMLKRKFL